MPDPDSTAGARRVCVGAIAGAHGVRGDVRLKSFCATPEAIAGYGPLETEDGAQHFAVRLTKPIKEGFGARLSGITTREAAEALKGTRLYVARARLPGLPDDEFYHADLIGLEARDTGGAPLGRVRAIHDHGAGDVIEIVGQGGEIAVPFTRWAVPTVDLASGVMVVDLPEDTADADAADDGDSKGAAGAQGEDVSTARSSDLAGKGGS